MDRDRNILFGLLAVQLSQVTPMQLAESARAWAADPSSNLADRLSETGALTTQGRAMLTGFVEQAFRAYDGDGKATLAAFGTLEEIVHLYRGSIGFDEDGEIEPIPGAELLWKNAEAVPAVEEPVNRYSELCEHSRGGMGRILLVQDGHLGRDIALKELLTHGQKKGSTGLGSSWRLSVPLMARFLQEARITGQLEHPSIVPVYEIGRRRDGTLYYTMKFVKGRTIEKAIHEANGLHERLALLPHFVDLCQAVAYAHSRGVIHRDIKPGNVMVGEFGETVLLDWGLAKARNREDIHASGIGESIRLLNTGNEDAARKTAYGSAVGTPAYMPPEQAEGKLEQVDERSDIYSLGAVLYEMLTGHAPYEGGTLYSTLWRVMTEEPPPISQHERNAPPELVAICQRAMQRDPDNRYQSAKALADEILRFQSGALVQTYEYRMVELFRRFIRRHAAMLGTAAAALVLLIAGGVLSYLRVVEERDRAIAAGEQERLARESEERAKEKEQEARYLAERESYSASVLLAQKDVEESLYATARDTLWGTPEDERDWEWGYLVARCHQDIFTFTGHEDRISDIAVSADGARFASASWDDTAQVWDLTQGVRTALLDAHTDGITSIAFSPDGLKLLTASFDATARLWDVLTGAELQTFRGHDGAVNMAAFSPDGSTIVTASPDKTARIWDAASGKCLAVLKGHANNVASAHFSPDGKRIITASWRDCARIWDADTHRVLLALNEPSGSCFDAIYSPDGQRIITTCLDDASRTAWIWDAGTGRVLATLAGHADRILSAAFSQDGRRIVTASSDKTGRIWNAETGALISVLSGHEKALNYAAFSPDGATVVTGSNDQTARLWDVEQGTCLAVWQGHEDAVIRAAFVQGGAHILTASLDNTARLWARNNPAESAIGAFAPPSFTVAGLEFSQDGKRVAYSTSREVASVWELQPPRELLSVTTFSEGVHATLSPDGKTLITAFREPGFSSNIWIWDVEKRAILGALEGNAGQVADAAFNPNGQTLATAAEDGVIRIWDLQSKREIRAIPTHVKTIFQIAFSADGKQIAAALSDQVARVWNAETGEERASFPTEAWVDNVAFRPDHRGFLTVSAKNVWLWPMSGKQDPVELDSEVEILSRNPFSPSNTRCIGAAAGKGYIWNTTTGKALLTLPGTACAAFHPNGMDVLTVDDHNQAHVLRAVPYRAKQLPGSESDTWKDRFEEYRRNQLKAPPILPAESAEVYNLVIASRAETCRRLRQLMRASETDPDLKKAVFTLANDDNTPENMEDVSERQDQNATADSISEGFRVDEGPALEALARLGFRQGDGIVAINDKAVKTPQACLDAFQRFLDASAAGQEPELTFTVYQGGVPRSVHCQFLDTEVTVNEISLPRTAFAELLSLQTPLGETDPKQLDEADRRQAKWHREPILDVAVSGFWLEPSYSPVMDNFIQQVGLQAGDLITSFNDRPIHGSRDFLAALESLQEGLKQGTIETCVIEAERGQFHRLTLHLTFIP